MTLKLKLLSLLVLAGFAITSCQKDPIEKDPINPKDPIEDPRTACDEGSNGIREGGCVRLQDEFNVVYLPLQCYRKNSTEIGVEKDGSYYSVRCDKSGRFGSYRPGEKVRLEYWFINDCIFTAACETPWADGCIGITDISDIDPTR